MSIEFESMQWVRYPRFEFGLPPSLSPFDRRFPAIAMYHDDASDPDPFFVPRLRRSGRNSEDRSPFNRIIVLRNPSNVGAISNNDIGGGGNYEIYYDDGTGASLRPLPYNISEFLMGSGFDRLLNQLAQLEVNGVSPLEQPPASKAAIESLPVVKILDSHLPNITFLLFTLKLMVVLVPPVVFQGGLHGRRAEEDQTKVVVFVVFYAVSPPFLGGLEVHPVVLVRDLLTGEVFDTVGDITTACTPFPWVIAGENEWKFIRFVWHKRTAVVSQAMIVGILY
ncbi:E3 ubiquitin-protein ligase RDUF1 [Cucurbita argyrosperma subsp. argyrosperma]|nr:E3 ubiquitin-protein ligase RDUF1 [Cucurbita argyrosperma subsp. argyrosperma]